MPADKYSRPLGLDEAGSCQKPAQKKSNACVPLNAVHNVFKSTILEWRVFQNFFKMP